MSQRRPTRPPDLPARPTAAAPHGPARPRVRPARPAGAPKPRRPAGRARTSSSTARSTSTGSGRRRSTPEDALRVAAEHGGFVWLGLYEPTEDELDAISARYGLHPLAVEDAVYAHQRPKLEHYDDALFMVLKTATVRGARGADRDQRGRRHRRGHGLPRRRTT